MDNKSSELETLRAERAKAEAERDLARKKIEQLQADLALAGQPKAAAEAQTAIFNAQKAQADAATAAANARVTSEKAKFGSVEGTKFGTTSVDANAAGLEASLLSAEAIDSAANWICNELKQLEFKRYALFTSSQRQQFGEYLLFQTKIATILDSYARADAAQKVVMVAAGGKRTEAVETRESVAIIATAAGASLDLISKLGSYFLSDYKFSPANVSGVDTDLLAVSLAARLAKKGDCIYPARWSPASDYSAIHGGLEPLEKQRHDARPQLKAVIEAQKQKTAEAAAEKDEGKKKELLGLADQYQRVADIHLSANKALDDLLTSLAEADSTGLARVTRIAEQKAVSDHLTDGLALLLHVGGGGGTTYIKKNLWTFFNMMAPFYVSGGAVVSFLAVDRKGFIKAAGQKQLHSGYLKAQSVAARYNHR